MENKLDKNMCIFSDVAWMRLEKSAFGSTLESLSFCDKAEKLPTGALFIGKYYFRESKFSDTSPDILSLCEKVRAEKFRFEEHRECYIAGRTLLRLVLGKFLNVEASSVDIKTTVDGKPYLSGEMGGKIFFNVSHTDSAYLFAIGAGHELGIDVEKYARIKEGELGKMFDFVSHPGEKKNWANTDPEDRAFIFTRLWTMKEAILKAHGTGLRIEARKVNLGEALLCGFGQVEIANASYSITSGALDAAHHFAVAVSDD